MPGDSSRAEGTNPTTPTRACDLTITNTDDLARLFPGWDGRFEQISAGPFRGQIQFTESRQTRVFRAVVNQRVLSRGAPQPNWVDLCPVFATNQETRWQRHCLEPDSLVLRGVGVNVDNLTGRQGEILVLSVPTELLDRAAEYSPGVNARCWHGWHGYRRNPASIQGFQRQVRRLLADALAPAACLDRERHALEQECLALAMLAIAPGDEPGHGRRQHRREHLVRRVEDFLRAHLLAPIGLVDLCAEFRVSARTLQYAFRNRYTVGPIEFLRILRLNAVRADLKRTQLDGQPIHTVARRWGYRHLGNFAAEYRRLFGELPSETRRASLR